MKKSLNAIIGFILICLVFKANAQTINNSNFIITGTITGVHSGVVQMVSQDLSVTDSAVIVNGKFTFRGKISLPERKSFVIKPGNWAFVGFVDDSVVTFHIDTLSAMHQFVKSKDYPIMMQIKETGSPLANVYAEYQKATGYNDCLSLFEKLKTAGKDSIAYLSNKKDSILNLVPGKEKLWIENYIRQNPGSLAGIFILDEYFRSTGDTSSTYLRSVLNQFSGAAKASSYFTSLANRLSILTGIQVGKFAPDFTLQKKDKSKFTMSTTRGSVVMLDFWASWCAPCRAGIPYWKKIYANYHPKGFNIISVSNDRIWGAWTQALDKEKMPWTQVIDKFPSKNSTSIVSDLYAVHSFPFFVLLDNNGKVVVASGDEEIVSRKIDEMLK